VTNLPTILREYVILWALGTLFGVTQNVDMITMRASNFGRFALAVLDVDMVFEVEPYLPNIGLQSKWTSQNEGNEDHGNGAAKDTEIKEAKNNRNTNLSDTSIGGTSHMTENEAPKAQMDMDNDDLLGEENEFSDAAYVFLGVQKGNSVNVTNAATLIALAPTHLLQHSS